MQFKTKIIKDKDKFFLMRTDNFFYSVLPRAKSKYMSWPRILGGQYLDNKYWPAYKVHDQMRGTMHKEKYLFITCADDAHKYLVHHLLNIGCPKWLAKLHYVILTIKDGD